MADFSRPLEFRGDARANLSAVGWESIDLKAGDGGRSWELSLRFPAPAQVDGPVRATVNLPGGGEMLRIPFKRVAATDGTRLLYLATLFGSRHMRERPFQQTRS